MSIDSFINDTFYPNPLDKIGSFGLTRLTAFLREKKSL